MDSFSGNDEDEEMDVIYKEWNFNDGSIFLFINVLMIIQLYKAAIEQPILRKLEVYYASESKKYFGLLSDDEAIAKVKFCIDFC